MNTRTGGLRAFLLMILVALLVLGCNSKSGSDGTNGADGNDGQTGQDGLPGQDGSNGGDGADGTDGTDGQDGQDGSNSPQTQLGRFDELPGLVFEVISLAGATGPSGTFQAGDVISVTYKVELGDGTALPVDDLDDARIWLAGPTTNYQLLISAKSDLASAAVRNPDDTYTYTFSVPIPAVYPAPLNDTTKFTAGELTGQALMPGTYTLFFRARKDYWFDGERIRDVANQTEDFLFDGSSILVARDVVQVDACNQCHDQLQFHGGSYRDTRVCVSCHTAGAEDSSSTDSGDMTNVTIEFKVMIHKIHNGAHLPSVNGVGTDINGDRDYTVTPVPYLVGSSGTNPSRTHDFSGIHFPVWPNLSEEMPVDDGFGSLSNDEEDQELAILTGVTDCSKCHTGSSTYLSNPTRAACGSCHDDIDWTRNYTANGLTMPPQANDQSCAGCHQVSGNPLAVVDAHRHPLTNPSFEPGLNFNISSVAEAGTNDGDNTLDPGEKIALTLTITDDLGNDVAAASVSNFFLVLNGPTHNAQMLLYRPLPSDVFGGGGPSYSFNVPAPYELEFLDDAANDAATEAFNTQGTPLYDQMGVATKVWTRSGTGVQTVLAAAVPAGQNYIDVADTTGFNDKRIFVLDDNGGNEEYVQIRAIAGNRLWLRSLYSTTIDSHTVLHDHAAGTTFTQVDLTALVLNTDYSINEATGTITELAVDSFPAGQAVIATYVADYVLPADYPVPLNNSPDLGEVQGEWAGKALASGTYTIGIWGYRNLTWTGHNETTTYRAASPAGTADFLVGDALSLEEYDLISSSDNCYACHNELRFHGAGRKDVEACLLCHATAGSEDRPFSEASNAAPTIGVTVNFREMLHKIHMGAALENAEDYTVVGFGGSAHTYEEVVFPTWPGEAKHCETCHGDSDAWRLIADRSHPTEQGALSPVRNWQAACSSCHDSDAAGAHFDLNTSTSGVESCSVCHGEDRDYDVEWVHKNR